MFYKPGLTIGEYNGLLFILPLANVENYINAYREKLDGIERKVSKAIHNYKRDKKWIYPIHFNNYYDINLVNEQINQYSSKLNQLWSYISELNYNFIHAQKELLYNFQVLSHAYNESQVCLIPYLEFLLNWSFYPIIFNREIRFEYRESDSVLVVDYLLPSIDDIPNTVKDKRSLLLMPISEPKLKKFYEEIIYSIVIRTLSEIFLMTHKNILILYVLMESLLKEMLVVVN